MTEPLNASSERPASGRSPTGGTATSWTDAVRHALAARCPACGKTPLFHGFLTVVTVCPACGLPLGELPADDAPPYVTILIVGHGVIGTMLLLAAETRLGTTALLAIAIPLAVGSAIALLRPVKAVLLAVLFKLDIRR